MLQITRQLFIENEVQMLTNYDQEFILIDE